MTFLGHPQDNKHCVNRVIQGYDINARKYNI